jgi:hypothetical protein
VNAALYQANHPARFWKLETKPAPSADQWAAAAACAASLLPSAALDRGAAIPDLLEMTLGEGQFGPEHWRLSRARRIYYWLKPLLPRKAIGGLRRMHRRALETDDHGLGWPVEDRYAWFMWSTVRHLLQVAGATEASFVYFWPNGRSCAFVLTHDIETAAGQHFVPRVAELEERLGFRSSFNFVAERYPLDRGLIRDLQSRGFEVGVHGLKHDGRLFSSRREFERRAAKINDHLRALGAVGFRSPLTHRNPEWMQSLDIEYDLSFFDTDPYEPLPGGTMSLWPFQLGRFLELPYTLVQDFTCSGRRPQRSGYKSWSSSNASTEWRCSTRIPTTCGRKGDSNSMQTSCNRSATVTITGVRCRATRRGGGVNGPKRRTLPPYEERWRG